MDVAMRDATASAAAGSSNWLADLRRLGVSALEIEVNFDMTTPHLHRPDGTSYGTTLDHKAWELRARLDDEGFRVSAILLATDFSGADAERHVLTAVRVCNTAANALNAPAVRIDPLHLDRSLTPEEVRQRFTARLTELLHRTADTGINLGIENHGPLANDPAFLDEVFRAIPDPRLGLTLDTGNFYWFGHPLSEVYRIVEHFAPRTKHTHVKNINYPPDLAEQRRPVGQGYKEYCCPLDEGNIDLRRVVEILRTAGYGGDLCVENESLFKYPVEQRLDVLKRDVRAVRAAMQ